MTDLLVFALLLPAIFVAPVGVEHGLDSPTNGVVFIGPAQTKPSERPALPPAVPRVGARQLLGGQPALTSFEPLSTILVRGHEVIVTDDAGRRTRGRVSSISPSHVAIVAFRPRQERSFAPTSVRTIQIVDSKADGALKGLAAAGVVVAAFAIADSQLPPSNLKGVRTMAALVSSPIFVCVGAWVDARNNASIYERPLQAPRVKLRPTVGLTAIGVAVDFHF